MAKVLTCDICKRPTKRIVGKLLYVPTQDDTSYSYSDYSAMADVGECCQQNVSKLIRFRQRRRRAKKEAEVA